MYFFHWLVRHGLSGTTSFKNAITPVIKSSSHPTTATCTGCSYNAHRATHSTQHNDFGRNGQVQGKHGPIARLGGRDRVATGQHGLGKLERCVQGDIETREWRRRPVDARQDGTFAFRRDKPDLHERVGRCDGHDQRVRHASSQRQCEQVPRRCIKLGGNKVVHAFVHRRPVHRSQRDGGCKVTERWHVPHVVGLPLANRAHRHGGLAIGKGAECRGGLSLRTRRYGKRGLDALGNHCRVGGGNVGHRHVIEYFNKVDVLLDKANRGIELVLSPGTPCRLLDSKQRGHALVGHVGFVVHATARRDNHRAPSRHPVGNALGGGVRHVGEHHIEHIKVVQTTRTAVFLNEDGDWQLRMSQRNVGGSEGSRIRPGRLQPNIRRFGIQYRHSCRVRRRGTRHDNVFKASELVQRRTHRRVRPTVAIHIVARVS
eukprot:m.175554 g.175554  ORF g.175554 m.175554 type:complete len:429 (-) comp14018_c0_seq1:2740-4026(-)